MLLKVLYLGKSAARYIDLTTEKNQKLNISVFTGAVPSKSLSFSFVTSFEINRNLRFVSSGHL